MTDPKSLLYYMGLGAFLGVLLDLVGFTDFSEIHNEGNNLILVLCVVGYCICKTIELNSRKDDDSDSNADTLAYRRNSVRGMD